MALNVLRRYTNRQIIDAKNFNFYMVALVKLERYHRIISRYSRVILALASRVAYALLISDFVLGRFAFRFAHLH